MKKYLFLLVFLFAMLAEAGGQIPPHEITKLKRQLSLGVSDSATINVLLELSNGYRFSNIDSALFYAEEAIKLGHSSGLRGLEGDAISQKGYILLEAGEIPEALQNQFTALGIAGWTNFHFKIQYTEILQVGYEVSELLFWCDSFFLKFISPNRMHNL